MSLIITVCTGEGIVLACDSRSTYTRTENNGGTKIVKYGIHTTDTTYKTFMCDDRIGISTCGNGTICGKSIASHIESYINNEYQKADTVGDTAQKHLDYFSKMPHAEPVIFHVAGYDKESGQDISRLYRIITLVNRKEIAIDNNCGAQWDGEAATLTRIIKNGYIVPENQVLRPKAVKVTVPDDQGTDVEHEIKNCMIIPDSSSRHPEMDIAWELLTLQDGIEFAEYAIKTTIDTMRFQMTPKTVAEPIDILIIKPNGAKWIKHKELHA